MTQKNILKRPLFYVLSILIIIVIFTPYFFVFNNGISNDSLEWGRFGNYIGGISGALNIIIVIYIAFFVNNYEQKRLQTEIEVNSRKILINRVLDINQKSIRNCAKLRTRLEYPLGDLNTFELELISYYEEYEFMENILKIYFKKSIISLDDLRNSISEYLNEIKLPEPSQRNKTKLKDKIITISKNLSTQINDFLINQLNFSKFFKES